MVADGYKDTEIGVIPVEWDVVKVGDFCDILDNKRVPLSSEQRTNIKGDVPYYGANGVVDYINDFLFDEELVLLAEDGGNFSEYETRPIAYMINGKAWVNNHTHILRAKNGQNYFLFYNLVHKNITAFINGGTRAKLNRGELVKIPFPLPPLKEQEKIADILSTADDKIDAIASQIKKAETLKKGLLQKLLSEGIGHSEFKDSELGKIPESWKVGKLGDMSAHISYGLTVRPNFIDDGIPLISATEIKDGQIDYDNAPKISEKDFNKLSNKAKPIKGDIFLSKTGTIGRVAYVQSDKIIAITQNIAVIRLDDMIYFQKFITQYMTTQIFQKSAIKKVNQSTIMDLQLQDIRKLLVPLPPLEEQKQIANVLSTADEKLEVLRAKKEKYETLKKGLLQKLLSGEVRV